MRHVIMLVSCIALSGCLGEEPGGTRTVESGQETGQAQNPRSQDWNDRGEGAVEQDAGHDASDVDADQDSGRDQEETVCALDCPFGLATDADGDELCQCAPKKFDERSIAVGQCVRNAGDSCQTDADCAIGGCGSELCYNPAESTDITTCDCTTPAAEGCGCVAGTCVWYE